MTLHLVLKYKWFDMIASGEKLEEYRTWNDYWKKRIYDKREEIEEVCFHRGYTDTTVTKKVQKIFISTGFAKWGGDPNMIYYVIRLKGCEQ